MCIMENVYWETIKLFEIEIEIEIYSVIPVCDVLKHCEHHWCGLDISEADRDFGFRFRVVHNYI